MKLSALVLLSFLISGVARADIIVPKLPRLLSIGTILDVQPDSLGNRYICGTTNGNGFLAKLTKKGDVLWNKPIDFGGTESSTALTLNSSDQIFVVTNTGANPVLRKYAPDGKLIWSETYPTDCDAFDVSLSPSGQPLTSGNDRTQHVMVQIWNSDGSETPLDDITLQWSQGCFRKITILADNFIALAGEATNGSYMNAMQMIVGGFSADLQKGWLYPSGNSDMRVDDLVHDESTGLIAGIGHRLTGPSKSYLVSMKPTNTSIGPTTVLTYDFPLGSKFQSLVTDNSGKMYMLENDDVDSNAGYSYLYCFNSTGNGLSELWETIVPQTGSSTTGYSLSAHNDNITVMTTSDEVHYNKSNPYRSYDLYTYDSAGNPLKRSSISTADIPAPDSIDLNSVIPHALTYFDNTLSIFAPTTGPDNAYWQVTQSGGPNDSYNAIKNETLIVSIPRAVFVNDSDGFSNTVTASIHPGSVQNLAFVQVHTPGTFKVTPAADFIGTAKFKYDVYDGSTLIATHTVFIHVQEAPLPPSAVDDSFSVGINSTTALDILANDSDPGGSEISLKSVTQGAHGRVTLDRVNQTLTYRPKHGYIGADSFTYTIKNANGDTATATVTMQVS